jgi:endonuclease/exonuclease/phosphatase family metal-dependent hydrolase
MFEENGYRDLIKEYKISTTRNRLAWEMYPDNKQLFSDYVFLSPGITINNFSVPDNEISDHLPMILEVSS